MEIKFLLAAVFLLSCISCAERSQSGVAPLSSVRAEVALKIGQTDGAKEFLFGEVSSVVADSEGRIYVADRVGKSVRAYSPQGEYLRLIGGAGSGPGEFTSPTALAFDAEGRLHVRDAYEIKIFAPDAATGIASRFERGVLHQSHPRYDARGARVGSDGRFYDPVYAYRSDAPPRYDYEIYDLSGGSMDTLPVPSYSNIEATRAARYMLSPNSGRMVQGLSHAPFEPVPTWDVTSSGTIIGGDGSSYLLVETNLSGDTLRTISGVRSSMDIPAEVRKDSLRALEARLDSLPVAVSELIGASQMALDRRMPEVYPAIRGIYATDKGSLWVEVWPEEAGTRLFDVYSPGLNYLESIALPDLLARDRPLFIADDAVYGAAVDSESGVETVVKLAILR